MNEPEPMPGSVKTFMAREIAEVPAVAAPLCSGWAEAERVASVLNARSFPFAVVCGRGSSGHAGVYLRYLLETRCGLAVSASAPSVVTGYDRPPRMDGALFITISQSGRSPDLIAATRSARQGGALTLALVNDAASPAAGAADLVLPIQAGPERAIAATKTVVNSLVASAALVARWSGDEALTRGLAALPQRLAAACELDWGAWTADLAGAPAAFVIGRGYGLGPAREIALKLCETMRLPALGYSTAELQHGPRAAIQSKVPVLALRQDDQVAEGIAALVQELRRADLRVHACGGPDGNLPWLAPDHAACDPIAMLVPAYRAIERESRRWGFDPDAPVGLSKITETL